MSKIWGYQQVAPHLKALLFWHGDTLDIPGISEVNQVISHVQSRGEYCNSNNDTEYFNLWF